MSVLQLGKIPQPLAEALAAKYETLQLPDDAARPAFLAQHAPSVTAIVEAGTSRVDADLMKALPNLGAVVLAHDGYNNVDVDTAGRLGIGVSHAPDVFDDAVADTAVGLILATIRGLPAADRYVRTGRWPIEGSCPTEGLPLTDEVSGSRVGILGLGRIGSAIAARLVGFKCAIAYHNRRPVPDCPYRYVASAVELAESVDVLVVATPGGNGTEKLVSRAVLEALGPKGYLINIARGSVVDEQALVQLLVDGQLAGAGLDVLAHEPDVPPELCALDNVALSPHIGGATRQALAAVTALVLQNLDEYVSHGTLTTPVPRSSQPPRCTQPRGTGT
jgi:lactate dehydrogenase-like 2-hydroxyacid dehydrogenase